MWASVEFFTPCCFSCPALFGGLIDCKNEDGIFRTMDRDIMIGNEVMVR